MSSRMARKSTNPFDDDYDGEDGKRTRRAENGSVLDESTDNNPQKQRRTAPLNFSDPFDGVEKPALSFDRVNRTTRAASIDEDGLFISPLRSAMHEIKEEESASGPKYIADEMSALLPPDESSRSAEYDAVSQQPTRSRRYRSSIPKEIQTGPDVPQRLPPHHQGARRRSTKTKKNSSSIIMTELAPVDGANEVVEYKYILLEDLGTASSWFILVLPYIAFALSMLLEYATSLSVSTIGPLQAMGLCDLERIHEVMHRVSIETKSTQLDELDKKPCYASFSMKNPFNNGESSFWSGTGFDSGSVGSMPVIGTYLYGDAVFPNMSLDALALVAQGRVKTSVVILENTTTTGSSGNQTQQQNGVWSPMFVSPSSTLSITCSHLENSNGAGFDCTTPDLISMAFSMPETAVYTGGDLRFFVLYEHVGSENEDLASRSKNDTITKRKNATITTNGQDVVNKTITLSSEQSQPLIAVLTERNIESPSIILEEMVSSSTYRIKYRSKTTVLLDTVMRSLSFVFSIGFVVFWCRQMGIRCYPCLKISCCLFGAPSPDRFSPKYWWENPWVLFPERYYIILLLFSLLLVQEPFLVAIYLSPQTRSNTMHMVADAAIGIGVQGILFVYVCLFEGLKFHTADLSKRRAERQRQALQLRKAVKFVGGYGPHDSIGSPAAVEDFYREFGDTDGSAFTSHLRLPSDPFGDGWADFILPKLFLWLIGTGCVALSAYCRFCGDQYPSENIISNDRDGNLSRIEIIYVFCSATQVLTILIWILLIIIALSRTGDSLKREPFLATRPAQLSYRVLFAHTALVISALLVSFILYLGHLRSDWHGQAIEVSVAQTEKSAFGLLVGAMKDTMTKFPYSGTAATVGFGRLLCVTVEILITAFIFLPAHSMDVDDCDEDTNEDFQGMELRHYRKNKRDKRAVVQLAKESKTWRIFPCPIQRDNSHDSPLQDSMYQLYKDLHTDRNMRERGIVSIGPYTPVFCNEVACWLNEASWQAYYTPRGSQHMTEKEDFIGWMNLDALGLNLEGYVYDERTNAQALIATNMAPQVDGAEDSIVVVAFRGSSNVAHIQIDIRMRQVPLMEQLTGVSEAAIRIFSDKALIDDKGGWFWDTCSDSHEAPEHVKCVACWEGAKTPPIPSPLSHAHSRHASSSTFEEHVAKSTKDLLKITPVAKNTFPMIHEGFQDAYVQIRKQIFDLLIPVLQRQLAKASSTNNASSVSNEPLALPKIYCTGHSLGGSLAQLFALDLASNCEFGLQTSPGPQSAAKNGMESDDVFIAPLVTPAETGTQPKTRLLQPPIAVYTFGQPRVGNRPFSKLYKQRVPHTFRVVNEGDAVTAIPNYLCCGGVYKHAGLEVILDQGMTGNILVGPTVVETLFRFHKVRTNIAAHQMARYRDCLECAFDSSQLTEYYKGHNVSHQELVEGGESKDKGTVGEDGDVTLTKISASGFAPASFIPDWMVAPRKTA